MFKIRNFRIKFKKKVSNKNRLIINFNKASQKKVNSANKIIILIKEIFKIHIWKNNL